MPRIVILQTSPISIDLAHTALLCGDLRENEDFALVSEVKNAEKLIQPGSRQLFVTGMVRGDAAAAAEAVGTLRKKNPELVTVEFSSFTPSIDAHFDRRVEKGVLYTSLLDAITDFDAGTLTRTAP
ncbi:MAG TPA: hypothetical protein VHE10_01695 [Candidatus Paceibacterota bacterium]|nr:hypothetical protein [Candidatus Paceibacterota bacterium]